VTLSESCVVSTLTTNTTWFTPGCIGSLCGAIGADNFMTYTPSHNVVEKVLSPVCRCDRCGQCLAYSITFPQSLCGSYWDVKPCKEHFYLHAPIILIRVSCVSWIPFSLSHVANSIQFCVVGFWRIDVLLPDKSIYQYSVSIYRKVQSSMWDFYSAV